MEINVDEFEDKVLKSDKPVMVEVWAAWCFPCRVMAPLLKEVAEEFEDRVHIYKINIDKNPTIGSEYDVLGVPTILLFEGGKLVGREIGAKSREQLRMILNRAHSCFNGKF